MPRPFEMLFIFSYDIPATKAGNRRRARLAKRLEGIGLRVQGSVFEVPLPPEHLERTVAALRPFLDEAEDSLRVYPLCAACAARVVRAGIDAPVEREAGMLVW